MVAKFIGLNKLDFTSKDGNQVKGIKIYVALPLTSRDESWEGARVESLWIDSNFKLPTMKSGEDYNFVFEGFGKKQYLTEITPVKL